MYTTSEPSWAWNTSHIFVNLTNKLTQIIKSFEPNVWTVLSPGYLCVCVYGVTCGFLQIRKIHDKTRLLEVQM